MASCNNDILNSNVFFVFQTSNFSLILIIYYRVCTKKELARRRFFNTVQYKSEPQTVLNQVAKVVQKI